MRKLKLTLMVAMMSISTFGFADNHTDSSEAEVLKVLSAYMDARILETLTPLSLCLVKLEL